MEHRARIRRLVQYASRLGVRRRSRRLSRQDERDPRHVAPGLTTLSHETVHPLVQHDFPLATKWLDEGVASLFHAPELRSSGEIHGVPNGRMTPLATALER